MILIFSAVAVFTAAAFRGAPGDRPFYAVMCGLCTAAFAAYLFLSSAL